MKNNLLRSSVSDDYKTRRKFTEHSFKVFEKNTTIHWMQILQ